MKTLKKHLYDKTKKESDLDYLDYGTESFCSWERMKPQLSILFGNKYGEKLIGIKIEEDGIVGVFERV